MIIQESLNIISYINLYKYNKKLKHMNLKHFKS